MLYRGFLTCHQRILLFHYLGGPRKGCDRGQVTDNAPSITNQHEASQQCSRRTSEGECKLKQISFWHRTRLTHEASQDSALQPRSRLMFCNPRPSRVGDVRA